MRFYATTIGNLTMNVYPVYTSSALILTERLNLSDVMQYFRPAALFSIHALREQLYFVSSFTL